MNIDKAKLDSINYDHFFLTEEIFKLCELLLAYHHQMERFENVLKGISSEALRNEITIINSLVSEIILALSRLNDNDTRTTSFKRYYAALVKENGNNEIVNLQQITQDYARKINNLVTNYRHLTLAHRNKDTGTLHPLTYHDTLIDEVKLLTEEAFRTFDILWQSEKKTFFGFKHSKHHIENYRETLKEYFT